MVLAEGEEPKFTKVLLDVLLDEYVAFRQSIRAQTLERSKVLIETMTKKSKELPERSEKLEAFRKTNAIALLTERHRAAADALAELKARRAKNLTEYERIHEALESVEASMNARTRSIGNKQLQTSAANSNKAST
jgi:hypothetical protein